MQASNRLAVVAPEHTKEFIKQFNKNKVDKEFSEKASRLFKRRGVMMGHCMDCTHYNFRDDKCRLGSDKNDCMDYEPQIGTFDYEEEEDECNIKSIVKEAIEDDFRDMHSHADNGYTDESGRYLYLTATEMKALYEELGGDVYNL